MNVLELKRAIVSELEPLLITKSVRDATMSEKAEGLESVLEKVRSIEEFNTIVNKALRSDHTVRSIELQSVLAQVNASMSDLPQVQPDYERHMTKATDFMRLLADQWKEKEGDDDGPDSVKYKLKALRECLALTKDNVDVLNQLMAVSRQVPVALGVFAVERGQLGVGNEASVVEVAKAYRDRAICHVRDLMRVLAGCRNARSGLRQLLERFKSCGEGLERLKLSIESSRGELEVLRSINNKHVEAEANRDAAEAEIGRLEKACDKKVKELTNRTLRMDATDEFAKGVLLLYQDKLVIESLKARKHMLRNHLKPRCSVEDVRDQNAQREGVTKLDDLRSHINDEVGLMEAMLAVMTTLSTAEAKGRTLAEEIETTAMAVVTKSVGGAGQALRFLDQFGRCAEGRHFSNVTGIARARANALNNKAREELGRELPADAALVKAALEAAEEEVAAALQLDQPWGALRVLL